MKTKLTIRKEMKMRGISMREMGRRTGIPPATLSRYLNISSRSTIGSKIPTDKLELIANALNVTPAYLQGWDDAIPSQTMSKIVRPVTKKKIPLLGNVACGEPIFADNDTQTFVDASGALDADFCLTAKGDSMTNARIFDGDLLFVRSQPVVENGEIAVVLIGDEATVKRVYIDYGENNTVEALSLMPENPLYKIKRFRGQELENIRILGKVVAGQHRIV